LVILLARARDTNEFLKIAADRIKTPEQLELRYDMLSGIALGKFEPQDAYFVMGSFMSEVCARWMQYRTTSVNKLLELRTLFIGQLSNAQIGSTQSGFLLGAVLGLNTIFRDNMAPE